MGFTPLCYLGRNGHEEMPKIYFEFLEELKLVNEALNTSYVLHYAVQKRQYEIIKYINAKDSSRVSHKRSMVKSKFNMSFFDEYFGVCEVTPVTIALLEKDAESFKLVFNKEDDKESVIKYSEFRIKNSYELNRKDVEGVKKAISEGITKSTL